MADTKLSALAELAATPAADDEVYIRDVSEAASDESKRITVANLTAAATKEFFVPVTYGDEMAFWNNHPVARCDATGEVAYTEFMVPSDFTSIVAAELIVIPRDTNATINWDIAAKYGAVGQSPATHNEDDNTTTYNVVNNVLFAIDISGVLSSLAAGDHVGVRFYQGAVGHNCDVVGVRFKYS